jgi:hypothetical protein
MTYCLELRRTCLLIDPMLAHVSLVSPPVRLLITKRLTRGCTAGEQIMIRNTGSLGTIELGEQRAARIGCDGSDGPRTRTGAMRAQLRLSDQGPCVDILRTSDEGTTGDEGIVPRRRCRLCGTRPFTIVTAT